MKPLARFFAGVRTWLAGAPGWVGGLLAGLQAGLFSLGIILLPAWAAVAAAPTELGEGPDWGGASAAATRFWLLGFGVPWDIDGVTVSLPPLGVPALAALMLMGLARRFADKTWTSWLFAVIAFAAVVGIATALTWHVAEDTTHRAFAAGLVAAGVAAPSVALGIWRAHGAELAWLSALPLAVRTGLRMGAGIVGAHVILAAAVGAVWTFTGRHAIAELATGLAPDAVGGVTLAALESLYVPTLVVWFMAWLVGVGFSVGVAHFAPSQLVESPLPQVPVLGALPTASGGLLVWAPFLFIAAVVAIRLMVRLRMPDGWVQRTATGAVAVACVFAATAALSGLSAGEIGPGTLTTSGVEWAPFAALTAAMAAGALMLTELVELGLRLIGVGGAGAHTPKSVDAPKPAPQRAEDEAASEEE